METIEDTAIRVAQISAQIKELESEKSNLITQLSDAWAIGDLDEYIDDKGNAVINSIRIERRSRTTWSYSPAIKALQQQEQFNGAAERKVTSYICIANVKGE